MLSNYAHFIISFNCYILLLEKNKSISIIRQKPFSFIRFTPYGPKFEMQDELLTAVPLHPKEMTDNVGRFLEIYSRDFFYVTAFEP